MGYGFRVVEGPQADTLIVAISKFSPGSQALRLTIGFGAGRGSLNYKVTYSKAGEAIVEHEGAERFTGLEFRFGDKYGPLAPLGDEDTATRILVGEAAEHIAELVVKKWADSPCPGM